MLNTVSKRRMSSLIIGSIHIVGFPYLKIEKFVGFFVVGFLVAGLLVSSFLGFRISWFRNLLVSKLPSSQTKIQCFLENIDPISKISTIWEFANKPLQAGRVNKNSPEFAGWGQVDKNSLAGWLAAGWLAAWLPGCWLLAAGWLAGWLADPISTILSARSNYTHPPTPPSIPASWLILTPPIQPANILLTNCH